MIQLGYLLWEDVTNVIGCETKDGQVDYPTRYTNGDVVWSFPERIPSYVKELVIYEMDRAQKLERKYTNDHLGYVIYD